MKTHLHENGWTVIVDEDINRLSDKDLHKVVRMIVSNMVVVFHNQTLTPEDEQRICSTIGNLQKMSEQISVSDSDRFVARVTGQLRNGKEGLFGHKHALDWHANQPSNLDRKPLIWLYGVEGTAGSRTSWINNIKSYEALDNDFKREIDLLEVYCGYQKGSYSDSEYFKEHINTDYPIRLVQTNEEDKTGLFFPFLQIFGMKNKNEKTFKNLMDRLTNHVLKEEFVYHHNWADGDLVISEQWLSIHKRWPFEDMGKRILHRIAFDHCHVYRKDG